MSVCGVRGVLSLAKREPKEMLVLMQLFLVRGIMLTPGKVWAVLVKTNIYTNTNPNMPVMRKTS